MRTSCIIHISEINKKMFDGIIKSIILEVNPEYEHILNQNFILTLMIKNFLGDEKYLIEIEKAKNEYHNKYKN